MSSSDEKNDSPGENDLLDDVFQYQSKNIHKNSAQTVEENVPSVEELASDNTLLSFARSVKVSYKISTPSSEASDVDQLGENCSSATVYSTPEQRNYKNLSSSVNAIVSPQQNPTAFSSSVLKDSDASEEKTNPRNPSPFAANRNVDYSSPPDRDTVPVNRSLSKCLKETNTPSPEKRNVDTDVGSTPIKRLRKTPESESGNSETYRSKLSFLGATKTSDKSPTNLQLQELKVEIQKTKESETLSSPTTPSKRKRNSSIESKITNDLCLSHSMSSSSAANTICESTFQGEITVQDVDESATKRKTLVSLGDCSAESNSLAMHSNPDDLVPSTSFCTLHMEKHESNVSKEPANAFSDKPNLKIRKQKDMLSISDILDAAASPDFIPKRPDPFVHLKPLIDVPECESYEVSGKKKGLPDVLFDVGQSYLPVNETKLTVHCPRLPDKSSCQSNEPASKFKNSSSKNFEPRIAAKDIQGASSASNVTDAVVESRKMDAALSNLMILNPKSFPVVHLPQPNISSVTSVPHRKTKLNLSDKKDGIDQNLSDSSTRTLTSNRNLRSFPIDLSVGKRRETHRRSLSDEMFTYRNLPEAPEARYQSNVLDESSTSYLGMRRRSVSDETFTSRLSEVPAERCQSDSIRGILTTSQFNESSTSRSLGMSRRSVSNETLTFTNLSNVESQQYQSNLLRNFQTKETSTSLPEISEGTSRKICVVKPLFQRMYARSASGAASALSNPREFSNYRTFNQHEITEARHFDLPSTSRNNTVVQSQQFLNVPIPRRRREGFLTEEVSTAGNHLEVASDVSQRMRERLLPGDASTSVNHPEVVNDTRERFLTGEASTLGNQPEVASNINSPNIDGHEGQTSTSSHQPIITAGSSLQVQPSSPTDRNESAVRAGEQFVSTLLGIMSTDISSDDPESVPQSGEAREIMTEAPLSLVREAELIDQARFLIQSVLREMMLYRGEDILWRSYETLLLRISESRLYQDAMNLHSLLLGYRVNRSYGLWHQNRRTTREKTVEAPTILTYEILLTVVVGALAFTLKQAVTREFADFMETYEDFRTLNTLFVNYSTSFNVDDIQDEVTKKRVKRRMKKIQSLLLRTWLPFQLLLIYIGENCSEEIMQDYERVVSDTDRMFLRSRPR